MTYDWTAGSGLVFHCGRELLQHILRACVLAGNDLHEPAAKAWCPCARDGREGGACTVGVVVE